MKRLLLALLLLAAPAAAQRTILAGDTDVTIMVAIKDSSSTTGAYLTGVLWNSATLTCAYARPLEASVNITMATQTVTGAHSDGGWVEIDSTDQPGLYRLDLPDAVVAAADPFVVVTCDGVTNMLGTNVQLQLVGVDPDSTSADLVDLVWDEVLTGGTHNVVNSSGRRLRQLQEAGGYSGCIWVDTVNGSSGTTSFENGTDTLPVDNIADANTLAAALGISRFCVAPGSTITFAATQSNQIFDGASWTLALGGQSIVGSTIIGASVSGVASGVGTTQVFDRCIMGAVTHIKGTHVLVSGISGTQTIGEAGDYFIDRSHSGVAGTGTPTLDWGALIGSTNISIRNYSGGWQFENMGDTGTDTASLEGRGQLVEGTCTGGTVAMRGLFTTTGIANLTLSDDARIDTTQVQSAILSDATPFQGADVGAILVDTAAGAAGPWTTGTGTSTLTQADLDNQFASTGALQAGSTKVSLVLAAAEPTTDDYWNDAVVEMTSGVMAGQSRRINNYTGATRQAQVQNGDDFIGAAAASAGDTYRIRSNGRVSVADSGINSLAFVSGAIGTNAVTATLWEKLLTDWSGSLEVGVGSTATNLVIDGGVPMDASPRWVDTQWMLTDGACAGQAIDIAAHTTLAVTPRLPMACIPSSGDIFALVWGARGGRVSSDTGLAQAGTTSTIRLQTGASTTNDRYNNWTLYTVGGTGSGQKREVIDFDGATLDATVYPPFDTAPDATTTYVILE